MDDNFLEILKDMLACLEVGQDFSDSLLHEEFKDFMLGYKYISEEELKSRIDKFNE